MKTMIYNEEYANAFHNFLLSEGGEIVVNCKTGLEIQDLANLLSMVDNRAYKHLDYNPTAKIYYWKVYKENLCYVLTKGRFMLTDKRTYKGKMFSYSSFNKRMNYFLFIKPKESTNIHK